MSLYHGRLQEALRIDPGSDPSARHAQVALLTRLAEQEPAARAECVVRLAELAGHWTNDGFAALQLERIKDPGEWILFREVQSSAGLYAVPGSGPKPLAQASQVRHALARPVDNSATAADYLLTGYRRLSLDLLESRPVTIELLIWQPQISFLPPPQLQLEVQVDDQSARRIDMKAVDQPQSIQLALAPGRHQIQLRIVNPFAGHYVFLNVFELDGSGQRCSWPEPTAESAQRLYHVATPSTPVKLRLRGPAWLRVERMIDGQRETNETTIAAGEREIVLAAPPGPKHAMYRIWEYRFGEAERGPPAFTQLVRDVEPTARWLDSTGVSDTFHLGQMPTASLASYSDSAPRLELAGLASADAPVSGYDLAEPFPLGGYEDGTWGFGVGLTKRRALEEGPQLSGDDHYLQWLLSYEHYNAQTDSYARSRGLFRMRDQSGPSFGLQQDYWTPVETLIAHLLPDSKCDGRPAHDWLNSARCHTLLTGYVQHPSDPLAFYDGRTEASLGVRSRLHCRYELNDHWYHLPSITFIARWLSLDEISYSPSRVDQDVFTPFKNDHRLGLYLTDTWIHEPVEFGRVWVRPALYTNEDLNPLSPDRISVHTGISVLHQNIDWQLAYRFAQFFNDEDRLESRSQHLLYLDAVLDHWRHSGQRFELSVTVRYELDDGETSAYLTLTCFQSRGRGYRDHYPSEVGFRSLRERQAFSTWRFLEPLRP